MTDVPERPSARSGRVMRSPNRSMTAAYASEFGDELRVTYLTI
jgi:hypothetical protein